MSGYFTISISARVVLGRDDLPGNDNGKVRHEIRYRIECRERLHMFDWATRNVPKWEDAAIRHIFGDPIKTLTRSRSPSTFIDTFSVAIRPW
jgi:hypothetical protein